MTMEVAKGVGSSRGWEDAAIVPRSRPERQSASVLLYLVRTAVVVEGNLASSPPRALSSVIRGLPWTLRVSPASNATLIYDACAPVTTQIFDVM